MTIDKPRKFARHWENEMQLMDLLELKRNAGWDVDGIWIMGCEKFDEVLMLKDVTGRYAFPAKLDTSIQQVRLLGFPIHISPIPQELSLFTRDRRCAYCGSICSAKKSCEKCGAPRPMPFTCKRCGIGLHETETKCSNCGMEKT